MNKIQSILLSKSDFEAGKEIDLLSNSKNIIGFNCVTDDLDNFNLNSTILLKVDNFEVFEEKTPLFLFTSNLNVNPNQRFFSLFGKIPTASKKIYVKGILAVANNIRINFLLEV